ncbi:MAG: YibE/F family protein [Oscillospiraceae bacterium]|nr:MAG: YibE/F family protein [Oscillospiraceae bacterium]
MMKQRLIYLTTVLCSILFLLVGNWIASDDMPQFEGIYQDRSVVARVEGILSRQSAAQEIGGIRYGRGTNILFAAEILDGEEKGQLVTAIQNVDPESPTQLREVKAGDKIILAYNPVEGAEVVWMLGEYVRTDALAVFGLIFAAALVLFGRRKGLNTLLSLGFTCLAIFVVFIPSILSGKNIYLWSVITCVYVIAMTLLIVEGPNQKCLCASIGCCAGLAVSGGLTLLCDHFLQLTGMVDENAMYLKYLVEDDPIDLKAIIFAAILVGAMGAIMDVAMSLASSLCELHEKAPECPAPVLFSSGITIGRDMMGTMANTLVLAYIGSSLSLTLLLVAYSRSTVALLNREMIVVEILQALVGSAGILLTIPLTSLISAIIYTRASRHHESAAPPAAPQDLPPAAEKDCGQL